MRFLSLSQRTKALIALCVVVPAGFGMKYYSGPLQWWINNWGSSFAYEIFFILLIFIAVPRRSIIGTTAVSVCLGTCILEFLQLWSFSGLEAMRSTFVGRCILGNQFYWLDFPAYPIGCFFGWLLLHRITADSRRADEH